MALTCQLDPDETLSQGYSSKIHHARNSQLWVIGRLLLCETCGCGRESRLAGISDSLHRSSFWKRVPRSNATTAALSSMSAKIWWYKTKTAHIILSIFCGSLVWAFTNQIHWFWSKEPAPCAILSNLWKVHAEIGIKWTYHILFHIYQVAV